MSYDASAPITQPPTYLVKRRWLRWLLIAGLVLSVLVAECVGAYYLVGFVLCGERVGPTIQSVSNQFSAKAVEGDCGATTAFRTRVIVRNNGYSQLVPRWYKEEAVFEARVPLEWVAIRWTGERQLTVTYFSGTEGRIERRRDGWGEVEITYVVVDDLP